MLNAHAPSVFCPRYCLSLDLTFLQVLLLPPPVAFSALPAHPGLVGIQGKHTILPKHQVTVIVAQSVIVAVSNSYSQSQSVTVSHSQSQICSALVFKINCQNLCPWSKLLLLRGCVERWGGRREEPFSATLKPHSLSKDFRWGI